MYYHVVLVSSSEHLFMCAYFPVLCLKNFVALRLMEEATNGNPGAPDTRTLKIISRAAFEIDDYWRIVEILHKRFLELCVLRFYQVVLYKDDSLMCAFYLLLLCCWYLSGSDW